MSSPSDQLPFIDQPRGAERPDEPVLLDVSRLVWRAWTGLLPTGIDRTCLAYVAHYRGRAQAVVQRDGVARTLSPGLSSALFDILLAWDRDAVRAQLRSLAWRGCWQLLTGRAAAGSLAGRLYLNVGHTGLDRSGHAAWLRRTGVRPVYFVHDLIPLTHPEYCRPGEPAKHLRRMTALLRNGAGVIANSRDTLNELAIFAGLQQALRMPPAIAAALGVAMDEKAGSGAAQAAMPVRPYFVVLGTIEGRKNHLLILNIWVELARRLGAACPQLLVIGRRGWECEQVVDLLERNEAIRGHVVELAGCDDAALMAYMRGARALLFPSFAEGYGLPLVEALASGTPVIASDLAVFHEMAAGIPDYLSPIDGLGWMRVIEDYTGADSTLRAAQLTRMSGWQAPSWGDHFAKVDRWLNQIVAIPRRSVSRSSD